MKITHQANVATVLSFQYGFPCAWFSCQIPPTNSLLFCSRTACTACHFHFQPIVRIESWVAASFRCCDGTIYEQITSKLCSTSKYGLQRSGCVSWKYRTVLWSYFKWCSSVSFGCIEFVHRRMCALDQILSCIGSSSFFSHFFFMVHCSCFFYWFSTYSLTILYICNRRHDAAICVHFDTHHRRFGPWILRVATENDSCALGARFVRMGSNAMPTKWLDGKAVIWSKLLVLWIMIVMNCDGAWEKSLAGSRAAIDTHDASL